MLAFERLNINGWRQFDAVDIEFSRRITILTGANGAGKSTLLSVLYNHFGWNRAYLSTPRLSKKGLFSFDSGMLAHLVRRFRAENSSEGRIGSLTYSNGHKTNIMLPIESGVQYGLNLQSMAMVSGLHIDSHRPISNYQQVGNLNISARDTDHFYEHYNNDARQGFHGGNANPIFRLKESLISMAVFGEGNTRVERNEALISAYDGFISILKKVLPLSIGFRDISIRHSDVVLLTDSGEFLIDAASGGLVSLIDLCWRIHLFSIGKERFAVTMDEPENHLHPSLQRTLLPSLIAAFPNAQFIVATHSPFMVTSVRDASIFVLRYSAVDGSMEKAEGATLLGERRVRSERLDPADRAGTANQTLRDVLGVPATTPVWVEDEVEAIVAPYRNKKATPQDIEDIRGKLQERGLDDSFGTAISQVIR